MRLYCSAVIVGSRSMKATMSQISESSCVGRNGLGEVRRLRQQALASLIRRLARSAVTGDAHLVEFLETSQGLFFGELLGRLHTASPNRDRATFGGVEEPRTDAGVRRGRRHVIGTAQNDAYASGRQDKQRKNKSD